MTSSPHRVFCLGILAVVVFANSTRAADSKTDDFSQTFSRLHGVMSDAVRAANDVYLSQQFGALSEDDLRRRIDGWWQAYMSDPATRRLWSLRMPADLVGSESTAGPIDPQSFLRTAVAIRNVQQRLRSDERALADLARVERFAAELARDFVRRGIVRTYQLRDSMWYEPVWCLAHQNGYCVDYACWYYWTSQLLGLKADIVLVSSSHARDYADHVLNTVAYADGKVELVEPQHARGFGNLAWVLVQTRSEGSWKLERLAPADFGRLNAADVQGLGIYALEALRYRQRGESTIEFVERCLFNPGFSDAKKFSSAVEKATRALTQYSSYADVSQAGGLHFQAAILLELSDLYRAGGRQETADRYASSGESICDDYAQPAHPLPLRIDACYMRSRFLVSRARRSLRQDPKLAGQLLESAGQCLRTAVELGAESRWQHLEYNFDLRMAEIRNLRSQIHGPNQPTATAEQAALSENEQARVHADKAVAAHRDLRDKLDADLKSTDRKHRPGIFNKRAFRRRADRYLRESYLTLGDVHQTRGLLLADFVRRRQAAGEPRSQATLEAAKKNLLTALEYFSMRSQADDITSEPDRMRTHEVQMHLASVSYLLGQADDARRHLVAAEKDATEIREHTPNPFALRQWESERKRLRAVLSEAYGDYARQKDGRAE